MASIIRDESPEDFAELQVHDGSGDLVSWVMDRVDRWRQYRDTSFKDRWDEYYRIFRGRWHVKDKSRISERSRLVNPALASALEQTVAEMEEATFGREAWIDVRDDDQDNTDVISARDRLLYDLSSVGAPDAVAESYLNGALYGELIMKLVVEPKRERALQREDTGKLTVLENDRVVVRWEPLEASEFVPDPSGRSIDEMLGVAHEVLRPMSWVERRQADDIFDDVPVYSWAGGTDPEGGDKQAERLDHEDHIANEDAVMITEYHGLVPERFLPEREESESTVQAKLDELIDEQAARSIEGERMVEAIITIANKGTLLKAVRNPFIMQDRGFVACQFEKVPGRFWGRGVMEKGYNPHKALDAELRARIDALALIANPMMGADATRLPRGFDLRVRPGKTWLTNGAPKDVLQPVQFAGLEPSTFNQSSELERMVNTATGAMDLNQMVRQAGQGTSGRPNASHSSMIQGAFIKRSKRAMNNVSRKFLEPLVKKTMWRYMQFEPARYPQDYDFRVIATMGIMAREFEQTQLTQLMGQVPDEMATPKLLLLQAIVENSSSTIKRPLIEAIRGEIQQMQSPEAQQARQRQQQLAEAAAVAEVRKDMADAALAEAKIESELANAYAALAEAGAIEGRMTLETMKTFIEARRAELLAEQNEIAAYDAVTARIQTRNRDAKES